MGHAVFISTFPLPHILRVPDVGSDYVSHLPIYQPSHGFAQDDWVYYDGSPYALAQGDAEATIAWGAVGRVIDANNFELVLGGIVTSVGHAVGSAGEEIYLSQTVAGAEENDPSNLTGGIIQPLGLVLDADNYFVGIQKAEWA